MRVIGIQAYNLPVHYEGERIPLIEVHRKYVRCFKEAVKKGDAALFPPFILGSHHWRMTSSGKEGWKSS